MTYVLSLPNKIKKYIVYRAICDQCGCEFLIEQDDPNFHTSYRSINSMVAGHANCPAHSYGIDCSNTKVPIYTRDAIEFESEDAFIQYLSKLPHIEPEGD